MKTIQSTLLATSLLGIISANAEPSGLLFGKLSGETAMDRAWSAATLYKDDDNPVLQQFSLQGRLHLQSIFGETDYDSFNTSDYKDAGNDETVWGNDIEARRARIGFKSKWFKTWKLDSMINIDVDGMDDAKNDTLYKDLYDFIVSYAPSDALNISAGKTKVKFTREQEISSNNILTIERSLLSNTLFPGELTGAWVNGKGIGGHWLYEFGVYSAERTREFSKFENGEVILAKIGYDYASHFGLDTGVTSFHIMNNSNPNYRETASRAYRGSASPNFDNSFALTNEMSQGRFGLISDITFAQGEGTQSDVTGISLIPSYFIAEGLQLVGRLQYATSEDPNDLQVPGRYERLAVRRKGVNDDERGDAYTSAYLGLNYYIYGDKLKLMNGIEYSEMSGGDYEGYTFMSGLRFSF